MPRVETKGALGEVFHIFNRGTDKREVFLDKEDYLRFYESLYLFNNVEPCTNFSFARLQDQRDRVNLVEVIAYCLLPNHFHLILRQTTENGIGELMKRVGGGYTSYFNEKHERTGVLFQGIYKRVLVETVEQYEYLLAYVNENHTLHGIKLDEDVMYSSTWHYRRCYKSKLIGDVADYDSKEGLKTAQAIYLNREIYKREIFDE